MALLAFVLTDLGALGGNNLILLVASLAWAALVVDGFFGSWNLWGLVVERHLPDELFARVGARGSFVLRNPRRWLAARRVEIADDVAHVDIPTVEAEAEEAALAFWRFAERGEVELQQLTLRSSFPFGLFRHQVVRSAPVSLLVCPCPDAGAGDRASPTATEGEPHGRGEGTGDLRDLRPYRVGDRLHALHWPTSARTGRPMVAVREAESTTGVLVDVREPRTERSLERATGAVLDAWAEGRPVGLRGLDTRLATARRGVRWRRRLLDALALASVAP